MLKRALVTVVAMLAVLVAALVVNTLRPAAPGGGIDAAPADAAPLPDAAAASERLARALRFPTVSWGDPARLDAAAFAGFRAFLREAYPRTFAALQWEEVNTHSLLARWPGSAPSAAPAMFIAHYDVVPVDAADAAKWSVDPFGGVLREGFVWGRGALDDKSSVIAILEAAERLLARGWVPRQDIYIGFGHDEEVGGSEGAAKIVETLAARGVSLGWMVDEGGAVSLPGMVPGVDRPVAMVGIAEKGYLSLELLARAQGGHSSVPRADSAIYRLAAALRVLEANPFPRQLDYLGWTAQAIAPELDFLPRLVTRNLWLFGRLLGPAFKWLPEIDAMTRTTTAPTMLDAGIKDNVQPTEARAVVNFRLLPGFSVEAARTRIAALVGPDVEVRALSANEASAAPSSMSGAGWQLLNASIQQAWHDVGGGLSPLAGDRLTVAPFLVMGGTDLKHYERIAKDQYRFGFLPMAKEDFRRLHGIDERVAVEALLGNIAFYHHLLRNAGEAP